MIGMPNTLHISPHIIEALYSEALVLSDEVRHAFTLSGQIETDSREEDFARVALSSEGLRTTTRMMHAIAWLLNQRAYFMGEISEYQLRRHGRLVRDAGIVTEVHLGVLDAAIVDLISRTRQLYGRLQRLDESMRAAFAEDDSQRSAIQRLRDRIERRLVG